MKNKLFKIGKPLLSIVVAVAIFAVSLFAAVPGFDIKANAAAVTDTWDGTLATGFASGSGTEKDPYIIATAEQLAYAALGAPTVSVGKYFKVTDNATFNLNGMADITLDSTVGDVMTATINKNWRPATDTSQSFAGFFDGNGVVIYNMCSSGYGYAGLFPRAFNNNSAKTSWIKNVTIMNSRANGYHNSGALIGLYDAPDTSRTATIENCKVLNCWTSDNNNTNPATQKTSGILVGSLSHNATTIKNCFVSGNVTSSGEISGGLVGNTSAFCPSVSIQNCIVLGSSVYPIVNGSTQKINKHLDVPGTYAGVYTDQDVDAKYTADQVKKLAESDMKGAAAKNNMPAFDWNTWIAFEGQLPDLRANHTLSLVNAGDSGHNVTCSDCGNSMLESHNMVENATGTIGSCECGYSAPITERRTDVWDGSFDKNFPAGDGTKNNPYIVKTAENFAYVALKTTPAESDGKYYVVAPNMVFNMNGLVGITMDSTADEVKAATYGKLWSGSTDNSASTFAGHFDGNGVIVYNVYTKGAYAGLFPNITSKNTNKISTIKNITLMASFMQGYHQSGGIVGIANAQNGEDSFTIENCAVKNCYIGDNGNTNPATHKIAGAIVGNITHNYTIVKNCFAIGNNVDGGNISSGIVGNCSAYSSGVEINNCVSIGTSAYPVTKTDYTIEAYMLSPLTYNYVYTDQVVNGFGKNQIKSFAIEFMSGANAPQNMKLDFGAYWFANEGVIDLLVCHNIEGSVNPTDGYAGHTAVCKACGLAGVVILNHQYTDDYNCTVCGFTCDHKNAEYQTVTEFKDEDCITPKNTKMECACGYSKQTNHSEPNGHVFEKTEAKAPTCAQDGNLEYWTCENCECIFLTDDIMAPYEDAVTQTQVTLKATGLHVEVTDSEGKIVYGMDDESHWKICVVCQAKLSRVEHTISYTADGAMVHDGKCDVCLYEAAENEKHLFGANDDNCNKCKLTCDHKDTVVAVAVADPTCEADGVNKAHYKCTICDMRFDDEAATTPIAKETVIVPKRGHDHVDFDENGTPVHEFNDTHHWYNCNVCGKGNYAEHVISEDTENYEGTYRWCEDENGYGCKYSTFDYRILDEESALLITAPTNAFTKDVITDIFTIKKDDLIYEDIKAIFDKTGQKYFFPYEISPNQEIAKGQKATIIMETPNDLSLDAALYLVDLESGKLKKMPTTTRTILLDKAGNLINENDDEDKKKAATPVNIATVTVDKFGYFVLASAGAVVEEGDSNTGVNVDGSMTSPETSDSTILFATIIAILASATVLFVRKAKI